MAEMEGSERSKRKQNKLKLLVLNRKVLLQGLYGQCPEWSRRTKFFKSNALVKDFNTPQFVISTHILHSKNKSSTS
jgi:hypothetical protein